MTVAFLGVMKCSGIRQNSLFIRNSGEFHYGQIGHMFFELCSMSALDAFIREEMGSGLLRQDLLPLGDHLGQLFQSLGMLFLEIVFLKVTIDVATSGEVARHHGCTTL